MNDFDKIFSEKLHNHKTPPPANGWDQLNAALDQEQNAKKKVVYWRVAAAVLLLLMGGAGWLSVHHSSQLFPLADETSIETEEPKKVDEPLGADSEPLALEKERVPADQATEQASKKQESVEEKNLAPATKSTSDEIEKVEKTQNRPAQAVQPTLASAERDTTDIVEIQPIESIQSIETLAVEPLGMAEGELLALASVKANVSPPVTIIYKPGVKSTDQMEERDEKGMALELLNDIKNSSLSFSDIRNAKAELLAKVFSKKESEVTH